MTARVIRWAISSTGHIAGRFAESLRLVPDARLVAVGSRTQAAADAFADTHGIASRHGSIERLAADPEVEAVYVASPHSAHHDDVLLLLEAGKAVLCEKPFALSETQAAAMVTAAEVQGVFLMEALWTRFLPPYLALRQLLDDGAIGAPRLVEADFGIRIPREQPPQHRLNKPELGGGAALDLGIYPVHLAHFVLGEPSRVEAIATLAGGVDETTAMLLGWPGGEQAVLHASIRLATSITARITGDDGWIHLPARMHHPTELIVARHDEEPRTIATPFDLPGLQYQVHEVHRCLRAGLVQSEFLSHRATLEMMRTLDRVRAAIGLHYPQERR
jgi:predicted dehydrogenase